MLSARLFGGRSVMSAPSIQMRPSSGLSNPPSILSRVVLPQPEGPSRAKKLPVGDAQRDPVNGDRRAVAAGDLVNFQQRLAHRFGFLF